MWRIKIWAEAEEAAVRTTAHIVREAIHIPDHHTDHPVLLTDLQVHHTDHRDLHTGPRVLRLRIIPAVHTGRGAAEVLAEGVSTAEEAAA